MREEKRKEERERGGELGTNADERENREEKENEFPEREK